MIERKSVEGRGSELLVYFAQRDPPTFTASEGAEFLGLDSKGLAQVLSVLVGRGWITRHARGVYEIAPLWSSPSEPFDPNRFTALDRWVKAPYYVGFRSALEIRDWLDYPVRRRIWIAVPNSRHAPSTNRDQVIWVVLRRELFGWGLERHWIGSGVVWVSDPERTLLDGLHLSKHVGGIAEVLQALVRVWNRLDRSRLLLHSERYGIDAVRRRLGYLLEISGLPGAEALAQELRPSLRPGRRSPVILDTTLPGDGEIDSSWGVRVNIDPADLVSIGQT